VDLSVTSPEQDPERTALLAHLAMHRHHVLGILEGLDEEQLHRTVLPSGWNCLGLVHHLALDDERFWFEGVVAGRQEVIDWVASDPDDAWKLGDEVSGQEVLDLYRRQIERSDEALASVDLDDAVQWWPEELFGDWRMDTVRQALLHMISETAVHAGHLDAARELIDGRTWMVL
jgi:hypothetical protein